MSALVKGLENGVELLQFATVRIVLCIIILYEMLYIAGNFQGGKIFVIFVG